MTCPLVDWVIELPAFVMLGSHTLLAGSTVNSDLHNNTHGVFGIGPDVTSPAVNFAVRGSGQKAWFGWPEDAKIEELREAWFAATDAATSKKAADAVQARAFDFVPYVPTAQFILPTAYRTNLSGMIIAPITLMWNVEKR